MLLILIEKLKQEDLMTEVSLSYIAKLGGRRDRRRNKFKNIKRNNLL